MGNIVPIFCMKHGLLGGTTSTRGTFHQRFSYYIWTVGLKDIVIIIIHTMFIYSFIIHLIYLLGLPWMPRQEGPNGYIAKIFLQYLLDVHGGASGSSLFLNIPQNCSVYSVAAFKLIRKWKLTPYKTSDKLVAMHDLFKHNSFKLGPLSPW